MFQKKTGFVLPWLDGLQRFVCDNVTAIYLASCINSSLYHTSTATVSFADLRMLLNGGKCVGAGVGGVA